MARSALRDGPDPVDVHVGLRIRTIRRERAMSQDDLAKALGLTFQQVQKYERGANRVSASVLVKTAQALNCSCAQLLPPPDSANASPVPTHVVQAMTTVRGMEELVRAFAGIESEEERAEVIRLAALLAKRNA